MKPKQKSRFRPQVEALEDRVCPEAVRWMGVDGDFLWTPPPGLDNNWGNPANWVPPRVPTITDDVVIPHSWPPQYHPRIPPGFDYPARSLSSWLMDWTTHPPPESTPTALTIEGSLYVAGGLSQWGNRMITASAPNIGGSGYLSIEGGTFEWTGGRISVGTLSVQSPGATLSTYFKVWGHASYLTVRDNVFFGPNPSLGPGAPVEVWWGHQFGGGRA